MRTRRTGAPPLIELAGKRAFVTGGGRGIGRATAELLARGGARVAVGYRDRASEAWETVKAIEDRGGHAVAIAGDLREPAAATNAVERATHALDGLDFLIVNHGIWEPAAVPLARMSVDQWIETRSTNLDGVFYVCRAAIPALASDGRIVLVASTAAQRGEAFHADYAATKGAIVALTKSLAVELAPERTVNCVAPGWVDTEMSDPAFTQDGGAGRRAIERTIPLGRLASPADVAGPIVFLCSSLARHITGEVLNVNGGAVLCG